jgi:hypothetical protein
MGYFLRHPRNVPAFLSCTLRHSRPHLRPHSKPVRLQSPQQDGCGLYLEPALIEVRLYLEPALVEVRFYLESA